MLLVLSLMAVMLLLLSPFGLRAYTDWRYAHHTYTVYDVPERPAALILGARVYASGRLSAMLADRVAAGVDLYHQGKVDVLVMSGTVDGNYNEPAAMRRYAMGLGVPTEAIVLDEAGFRTYDSCYRARDVFALESVTVVTQAFHLDRALLLCRTLGLDAVGVAADYQRPAGYLRRSFYWSHLREVPATVMAVADLIRRRPPAVLGEPRPLQ